MNSDSEVYFHLGFPKVASTYFQNIVFPRLKDLTFFTKHQFNVYKKFDKSQEKGKILFSLEHHLNIIEKVEEIIKIYPQAKIILFVRRQDDWILSRYKYSIRKHNRTDFNNFFNLKNTGIWKRESLFFGEIIKEITKRCNTQVLVLTYDLLKKDPEKFIDLLLSYIGTSINQEKLKEQGINVAFNEKQLIILRKWNRIYPYTKREIKNLRNKIHYKYREFLLHTVAFFAQFIPLVFIREKKFLSEKDEENLMHIREYYAVDWEYCLEVEKKCMELLYGKKI